MVFVRLFKTNTGRAIVREELDALGRDAKAAVLAALKRRACGKHLAREDEQVKGGIRAIRTSLDGREYRLLYATVGAHDHVYLGVHALEKKTVKLPRKAIKKAEKRLKEWEARA